MMTTDLYIGPLLERSGKFSYDTFSVGEGFRHSFRYPRIEQARHDQRAMIAEAAADPRVSVHICETVSEFEERTAGAPAEATIPKGGRAEEW
jgi:hypothetical protein